MNDIPGVHPGYKAPAHPAMGDGTVALKPGAVVTEKTPSEVSPTPHGASPVHEDVEEATASPRVVAAERPNEEETASVTLMAESTSKAIDEVITNWFQTEVHGSEISQSTPAYNRLRAILPKLAASLKGIM